MPEAAPSPTRWWVLANVVVINVLVTGGAWNYVIMVVPQVVADLGLEIGDWGTLWSGIALGILLASIPAGALGDRFGVRFVMGGGLVLTAAVLWLRSVATDWTSLYLALVGFGAALSVVLANFPKAIGVWFPPSELGLANGLAQAGVGVGLGAAAFFTPLLVEPMGGWRGLTQLLSAASLGLAAIWMLGVGDRVQDPRDPESAGLVASIAAALRVREVRLVALCYLLYVAGYLGAIGYLPTYFAEEQGMSPSAAGAVVSLGPWSFIAGSLLLPTLSDRIGLRRRVYLPGMLAAGLALFAAAHVLGASLAFAMATLGFASGVVALLFVIPVETEGIGQELAGSAVGVTTTAGFLGGALSPPIGMALVGASPVLGFGFWALCFAASALLVLAVRETGPRATG